MNTPPANRRRRLLLLGTGTVLWIAVFAVLIRAWVVRGRADGSPREGPSPAPFSMKQPFRPYELPDFQLTDQNGNKVTKADLKGRQWVASFFYTRCKTVCPAVTARLRTLQDALGGTDVLIVSISVDPEGDTAEVLDRHAKTNNADPRHWLFLRSDDRQRLYRLLKDGFHVAAAENTDPDRQPDDDFTHSQKVMHVDENGTVIGIYDGASEFEMERLRQALVKRSAERQ